LYARGLWFATGVRGEREGGDLADRVLHGWVVG
jgi:hypothetical protein